MGYGRQHMKTHQFQGFERQRLDLPRGRLEPFSPLFSAHREHRWRRVALASNRRGTFCAPPTRPAASDDSRYRYIRRASQNVFAVSHMMSAYPLFLQCYIGSDFFYAGRAAQKGWIPPSITPYTTWLQSASPAPTRKRG